MTEREDEEGRGSGERGASGGGKTKECGKLEMRVCACMCGGRGSGERG